MESFTQQGQGVRWVVMGVCGCGKSTVGQSLARALGVPYVEGDAFHPAANVEKMKAGLALDDEDRAGWLRALRDEIAAARAKGSGLVVGCSALKRRYRDLLREGDPQLRFAHLQGERAVIEQRMRERPNHYMPTSLLDSQLRDLEPLQPDEEGIVLHIGAAPHELVARVLDTAR